MNCNKYLTSSQREYLQSNLKQDLSVYYAKRIQIMLLADEGKSQREICQILGSTSATVRYWMQFLSCGMVDKWKDNPVGRPPTVSDEYLGRLKELVNNSPRNYGYAFHRWTADWLSKHLAKEFGTKVSGYHITRLLEKMELSIKNSH